MGTLIHAPAHGLVGGESIMLGNLVGGAGLSENTLYWVLVSGLTADDFQVSDSQGGAAIVYTTDITDGVVVLTDTYSVVSDGIQDPPDAQVLSAPTLPVLTSVEVSGIVRLYVELPSYADSAIRVRLTEVQLTHSFDGATPLWESATTLSMPLGTNTMSIPALGSTLYAARSRVQDVYGNYSDYSTVAQLTTNAGVDSKVPADLSVTTDKIATNAIVARHVLAGQIDADKLAATLVLASLIKTANSGRRIEIDIDGIRLFDASEGLLVRIPTNGDPVYVKGEVNADSLISQTAASFRTAASLEANAVLTAQTGYSAPTVAPSVAASVDSQALTGTPATPGISTAAGIAYDSAAGTFWIAADPTTSTYVAHEFNASTGAYVRSISRTGSTSVVTTTLGSTTHVSDTTDATSGSSESHITTPLTMPRAGRVTKVSVWMAGYGGSCAAKVGLWNSSGTALRMSAGFTAVSETFSNGNDDHYDRSLTSSYSATSGQVLYAGFMRTSSGDGFFWSKDDGTSKTTYSGDGVADSATGFGLRDSNSKPNVYITYEYDVSTVLETATNVGIATDGSYIYTLDSNGVVWKYDRTTLAYVASASMAASITGTKANAGLFYHSGLLYITTFTGVSASESSKMVVVNPALTLNTSFALGTSIYHGSTATSRGGWVGTDALNGGVTEYWVNINGQVTAFLTSTGAAVANREFGTTTTMNSGVCHDGTQFRGWSVASPTTVWKFSAWDWTTASALYWVCYAWYDPDGTTHETVVGPRASLTMRRRERMLVTTAAIPGSGGADDPDNARVYMKPNATDPGAGNFKLQVTDAVTSRYLTDYNSSGGADGAGTPFTTGSPAELKSAASGWSLKGDGSVRLPNGQWVTSADTKNRLFFGANDRSYFGSQNGYEWRDAADASIMQLSNTGVLSGNLGGWNSFTTTVGGAGTATFTQACRYIQIGPLVFFNIELTCTGAGAGGGTLGPSLPVTIATSNMTFVGQATGLVTALNGVLYGQGNAGAAGFAAIRDQAGTAVTRAHLQNGSVLRFSGFYSAI
jgi:hypothetical protein